jgi:nucleotide-binding universal stress UspA family protein
MTDGGGVMIRNILVPVDSSTFAEQALPHALAVAKATRARIHLVMVHEVRPPGEWFATFSSVLVEAQPREVEDEYLDALEKRLAERLGVEPAVRLLSGTVASALSRYVTREDIDLIVMSSHGRSGFNRAWMGSVADALARRSRVPILLVKPLEGGDEQMEVSTDRDVAEVSIQRILAAVDGSDDGESAARYAATLCAATGAQCTVVRVVVPPIRVIASGIRDTARLVRESVESQMQEAERYLRDLPGRLNLPVLDVEPEPGRAPVEPGALEQVAALSIGWLRSHFPQPDRHPSGR